MKKWERARKPEQKAVRRDAILKAARTLFSELEYDEISLNGIAREAGFSKPNIYRYFSTREEIFLAIYEVEQGKFVRSLVSRLKKMRSKDKVSGISRIWVEVLLKHETLLNLIPQLSPSMERNSSVDQLVLFKKQGHEQFLEVVATLEEHCPSLNSEQWAVVVQCAFSMIAGLWPIANPSENIIEALQEVKQTPWEFEPVLTFGMTALIQGAIERNKQ